MIRAEQLESWMKAQKGGAAGAFESGSSTDGITISCGERCRSLALIMCNDCESAVANAVEAGRWNGVDVSRQGTTLMGLSGRKEETIERRSERKGRTVKTFK